MTGPVADMLLCVRGRPEAALGNKKPARGTISAAFGYASEQTVRLTLTAVAGVFVARYLGPGGLGLLSFASGVFALLAPLTLLGMRQVLVRELSGIGDRRTIVLAALASQAPVSLIASLAGFLVIASSRGFERNAMLLGLVLSPVPLLGLSDTLRASLEVSRRVKRIVVAGIAASAIATLLKVVGVGLKAPVWVFGLLVTVEAGLVLVGVAGAFVKPGARRMRAGMRVPRIERDVARRLLRESWPLLIGSVAVSVYLKADILMLGVLSADRQTGLYTAAARLSEIWYFIPLSAAAAVRPRLSRLYNQGEIARYTAYTQRFMTAAVGASMAVLILVLLFADKIMTLMYGPAYHQAGEVLRIHILSAPFVFLGLAGSQWFVDRSLTRAVMWRSVAGAIINVVLNLALIPRYGAVGSAIATLVAYASGVCLNFFGRETRPVFWMQVRACVLVWPALNE